MHRVDADGYITVLGNRRFVDRLLPTYEGTVDGAYWNNAVQEEICNVVTYAGLTLRTSGAADESAGWTQLRDAIFSSGKISNDGLANDLDISKCSQGEIDISYGGYGYTVTHDGVSFGSGSSTLSCDYSKYGIGYFGTSSPGTVSATFRHAIFNITAFISGATVDDAISGTTDSHYHKIGQEYDNIYVTDINKSARILGAIVTGVKTSSTNQTVVNAEVEFSAGTTYWEIVRIIQLQATSSDILSASDAVYLTVFFDASYLVP